MISVNVDRVEIGGGKPAIFSIHINVGTARARSSADTCVHVYWQAGTYQPRNIYEGQEGSEHQSMNHAKEELETKGKEETVCG